MLYTCKLEPQQPPPEEENEPVAAVEIAGDGNAMATDPAAALTQRQQDPLQPLNGLCSTLSQGWWSYEWCHRRHVRQFHFDRGTRKRDPEWSLGDYSEGRTSVVADVGAAGPAAT